MTFFGNPGDRLDPVLGYNFLVNLLDSSSKLALAQSVTLSTIRDVAVGGFSECSGLEMSLDIEEYEEGGRNGYVLKFPTRVKWSNITLKKGLGVSQALWDWHYSFAIGEGKRLDGIITLQTADHKPHAIWHFRRGLPVKWTGPSLNASQNEVAIEAVEIAHEGIYQLPAVSTITTVVADIIGLVT